MGISLIKRKLDFPSLRPAWKMLLNVFPLFDRIYLIESIGGDYMGDIKMCSSCGNSIPVEAVFCPNCGQKQEAVIQEQEQAVQTLKNPYIKMLKKLRLQSPFLRLKTMENRMQAISLSKIIRNRQ